MHLIIFSWRHRIRWNDRWVGPIKVSVCLHWGTTLDQCWPINGHITIRLATNWRSKFHHHHDHNYPPTTTMIILEPMPPLNYCCKRNGLCCRRFRWIDSNRRRGFYSVPFSRMRSVAIERVRHVILNWSVSHFSLSTHTVWKSISQSVCLGKILRTKKTGRCTTTPNNDHQPHDRRSQVP